MLVITVTVLPVFTIQFLYSVHCHLPTLNPFIKWISKMRRLQRVGDILILYTWI